MFGTSGNCAACCKAIPAFEMVMRAKSNVYHLDCFACQQCHQRFIFLLNEKKGNEMKIQKLNWQVLRGRPVLPQRQQDPVRVRLRGAIGGGQHAVQQQWLDAAHSKASVWHTSSKATFTSGLHLLTLIFFGISFFFAFLVCLFCCRLLMSRLQSGDGAIGYDTQDGGSLFHHRHEQQQTGYDHQQLSDAASQFRGAASNMYQQQQQQQYAPNRQLHHLAGNSQQQHKHGSPSDGSSSGYGSPDSVLLDER